MGSPSCSSAASVSAATASSSRPFTRASNALAMRSNARSGGGTLPCRCPAESARAREAARAAASVASFHSHIVSVDRGSNGVGLSTGARYPQVGSQGTTFFVSAKIDEVQTFVVRGAVIGQGKTRDLRAHETFHLTVGPTGRVVVEFDKARFTCR